ncbi:uncharacterized protein LOC104869229 isoform X2 [Fukomys damarensis]|uniref:uncharacterized protein LOC104869229 isoform X2 n=1 Tax=Fukomys damarensis TaxID=885580 RepID=UPI00053F5CAA|nr:uncharacterized protein LOC104869229 isoform X2 [Fukomys damarensis]
MKYLRCAFERPGSVSLCWCLLIRSPLCGTYYASSDCVRRPRPLAITSSHAALPNVVTWGLTRTLGSCHAVAVRSKAVLTWLPPPARATPTLPTKPWHAGPGSLRSSGDSAASCFAPAPHPCCCCLQPLSPQHTVQVPVWGSSVRGPRVLHTAESGLLGLMGMSKAVQCVRSDGGVTAHAPSVCHIDPMKLLRSRH